MTKYPLKLVPQVRTALWGREYWLVSAHPTQPSVVANGPYAGRTLLELTATFGDELVGTKVAAADGFPLLVKVIEAKDRLSLQVHPCEGTRELCGGDPKTEMWYVLGGGEPGACIYAGLKDGVDRDVLSRSLHDGTAEDRVVRFEAHRGDVLFIPGGLVHAIGGGCRLYEVQQTSDTTWRLHDWNRIDPKTGLSRPLHEREGLAAIDWTLPPPKILHDDRALSQPLVACDHFRFSTFALSSPTVLPGAKESFRIIFAEEGACRLEVAGVETVPLAAEECAIIPADTGLSIVPETFTKVLMAER